MKISLSKITSAAEFLSMLVAAEGGADGASKLEAVLDLGTRETSARLKEQKDIENWRTYVEQIRVKADAGNKAAQKMLYEIALASTSELAKHSKNVQSLFRQFASKQICLPVVMWPFPAQRQAALDEFDSLLVGSQVATPVNPRPIFNERENATPARTWIGEIALQIYALHQAVYWSPVPTSATAEIEIELPAGCHFTEPEVITALNLPRLDCERARSHWLNFLYEYGLRESGGTISQHPVLGTIGEARANSDPKSFRKENIKSKQRRLNTWERTAESAIKRAMKDSLKSYSFS